MKLKKKHRKIAKTISYFVDREAYFPDFKEPTEEQIQLFFHIESKGDKDLSDEQLKMVRPMLNGKANYDLQIKMIHEEILEWMCQRWGWWYPLSSCIQNIYKDRHKCPSYVSVLRDLKKKMTIPLTWDGEELSPSLTVMLNYSGFSEEQKEKLIRSYGIHTH